MTASLLHSLINKHLCPSPQKSQGKGQLEYGILATFISQAVLLELLHSDAWPLFISYYKQRMYQDQFIDYPLQLLQGAVSPLNNYLPNQQGESFMADLPLQSVSNLPLQSSSNPYMPCTRSRLQTLNSNNSVSKWAYTEMSTQDNKDEESLIPCFLEVGGNAKEEPVNEATFKPYQLQEHLKEAKREAGSQVGVKESQSLKRLLSTTLLKRPRQVRDKENRVPKERGKTKYQTILDEFFKKPVSAAKADPKLARIEDYRSRQERQKIKIPSAYRQQHAVKTRNLSDACKINDEPPSTTQPDTLSDYRKQIPPKQATDIPRNTLKRPGLTKTFSHPSFSRKAECRPHRIEEAQSNKEERWMKMSFTERQRRTLESRRQKEALGTKLREEKELRGCSFKPKTTAYRQRRQEQTASSYAKLYLQKVRRRV